jgi:hypothetical protein
MEIYRMMLFPEHAIIHLDDLSSIIYSCIVSCWV